MSSLENFLLIAFVALMLLHTAAGATEYVIPTAKSVTQTFNLDGGTMNGSTLTFANPNGLRTHFSFKWSTPYSSVATVTYVINNKTTVAVLPFTIPVTTTEVNFTLTGNWTSANAATGTYYIPNGNVTEDNDRNATNLPVEGTFALLYAKGIPQRIWTRENCSVVITTRGLTGTLPSGCEAMLNFTGIKEAVNASMVGVTVESTEIPVTFVVTSRCYYGFVMLLYREGCMSETTTETTTSTTQPSSFPSGAPQTSAPASAATGAPQTSAPTSAATYGVNVMAHSLLITIALVLTRIM
ncbi:unnamed protein product [Calicophoron daubneyi]|uniref:Uncharacterized protein n=1 Tax=Calicophoron daubneyi TaxID=300641 RepID=A0AAV2TVK7_CALDB